MAVRNFNGTATYTGPGDNIVFDIGALSGMTYGTFAFLCIVDEDSFHILFALHNGSGDEVSGFYYGDSSGGSAPDLFMERLQPSSSEVFWEDELPITGFPWRLLVVRKASGSATPRISHYDYDADSWSHGNASGTLANWSNPGASGSAQFAGESPPDFFGDVAAVAVWANSLPWSADASGDSAIESAGLETAAANWLDASPDAMWLFNQAAVTTDVEDVTGNGADQTSRSGTSVVTDNDPSGFDFSLSTATAVGQATETDVAQPIGAAKTKTLGQASETDLAQSVTASSTIVVPIGQATETDDAQPITVPVDDDPASYEFHIDWNGDGDFDDTGENVTEQVRDTIDIGYGRDQARSLSPARVGEARFELDNTSRDYSPENDSSPLAGNILPARSVRAQATHDGQTHNLFRGFTDGFDVLPALPERRVRISCLDALARFRGARISTELHHGIRTGTAVGIVLDAIGWPEDDRDLDVGVTTIPWFWLDREDALTALEQIVNSEGPPALGTVDGDGNLVFRDRHHRLTRSASLTSQTTLGDDGTEPMISDNVVYDHGWRDIVNSVNLSVEQRRPASADDEVWSSDLIYTVADGETVTVRTQPSDPVLDAITPVEDTDYRLRSGTVDVVLSRTSGTAISIMITGVGGPAVLDQLRLRAFPVTVRSTVEVEVSDPVSIERFGIRAPNLDAPWVNQHDALAIGEIVLAQRAERLPIVTVQLDGLTGERLTQQLTRDLSDRVTIDESEIGLDDDFYIERIDHVISHSGFSHVTSFGCEKVAAQVEDVFTFDVAGAGFDDGKFGRTGLSDPDNIFRFDTAGQGFDDGLFAY